jgi:hypothetical protein
MITRNDNDNLITIRMNDLTLARLLEMADDCHAYPEAVAAALLHDLLLDDALAHGEVSESLQ